MLPVPKDVPASCHKTLVGVAIPLAITCDLLRPPLRVRFRGARAGRASVPEAPVGEYGDTLAREDEVSPTPKLWQRATIDPVPQAQPPARSPER